MRRRLEVHGLRRPPAGEERGVVGLLEGVPEVDPGVVDEEEGIAEGRDDLAVETATLFVVPELGLEDGGPGASRGSDVPRDLLGLRAVPAVVDRDAGICSGRGAVPSRRRSRGRRPVTRATRPSRSRRGETAGVVASIRGVSHRGSGASASRADSGEGAERAGELAEGEEGGLRPHEARHAARGSRRGGGCCAGSSRRTRRRAGGAASRPRRPRRGRRRSARRGGRRSRRRGRGGRARRRRPSARGPFRSSPRSGRARGRCRRGDRGRRPGGRHGAGHPSRRAPRGGRGRPSRGGAGRDPGAFRRRGRYRRRAPRCRRRSIRRIDVPVPRLTRRCGACSCRPARPARSGSPAPQAANSSTTATDRDGARRSASGVAPPPVAADVAKRVTEEERVEQPLVPGRGDERLERLERPVDGHGHGLHERGAQVDAGVPETHRGDCRRSGPAVRSG